MREMLYRFGVPTVEYERPKRPGEQPKLGLARPARTTWEAIVRVRTAMIEYEAGQENIEPGPRASIHDLLVQVRQVVENRPRLSWRRLHTWWTGADIESAWRGIHAAEEVLYEHMREQSLRPRLGGIYAYARSYLGEQDLRVVQLHLLVGREIGEGTIERTSSAQPPTRPRARRGLLK